MSPSEIQAHWIAVGAYAAATLAGGAGVAFGSRRGRAAAMVLLGLGVAWHALALGLRWAAAGHGPYLGRYEAFSSYALSVVVLFLLLQARVAALRPGVALVAGAAFLLLGMAVLSPSAPTYPSPALRSPWLVIHVSVAKLALATALAAGTAAVLRLAGGAAVLKLPGGAAVPRLGRGAALLRLAGGTATLGEGGVLAWAEAPRLDRLASALLGYTFFLMSVVILSGALWASAAWGSYWSWDPVETWSLTFWAACAFVLHLRRAGGVRSHVWLRWVAGLTALGVLSFMGYGHFGISLHAAYVAP